MQPNGLIDASGDVLVEGGASGHVSEPSPHPDRSDVQSRVPRREVLSMPVWLHRVSSWAWRLVVIGIALVGLVWLLDRVRVVVVPVLAAVMLASVISPLVQRLHRRGVPLLLSTWIVLLTIGAVLAGIAVGVVWGLTSELTSEAERWRQTGDDVRAWLQTGPLGLDEASVAELEMNVRDTIIGGATSFGRTRAMLIVEVVSGLFLTVALTFFFVKDGQRMWGWIVARIHPDRRAAVDEAGRVATTTLGAYLRAVSLTGFIDAVVIGIGLYFIGVPLVIPLAIITFFGAFLPVVGATAAGAVAAVVALVANGPGDALLVVLLTLVVQQIEGDIVMPVVMGRQIPLHPAVVLAALAAGGALAGVIGAFVAVPVAAIATATIGVFRQHRMLDLPGRDVAAEA